MRVVRRSKNRRVWRRAARSEAMKAGGVGARG